jgi:hypothetical protein
VRLRSEDDAAGYSGSVGLVAEQVAGFLGTAETVVSAGSGWRWLLGIVVIIADSVGRRNANH